MKEKKPKAIYPIVIGIAVLVVLLVVGSYILFSGKKDASGGLSVAKDTVEWNQDLQSSDENADIQIPYYQDIYMKSGQKEVQMMLVNPKENSCYFSYVFKLSDTGEVIYQSDLIEPGKALESFELERSMEAGEYDLDIQINTYSTEDKTELNNAIVSTKLIASEGGNE